MPPGEHPAIEGAQPARLLTLFDPLVEPEDRTKISKRLMEPAERIFALQALGCRAFIRHWRRAAGKGSILNEAQAVSLVLDMGLARSIEQARSILDSLSLVTFSTQPKWWHLFGLFANPGEYDFLALGKLADASGSRIAYRLESGTTAP